MPYAVSDVEHYVRCLRVYAVLLQRGEAVEIDNHGWSQERGSYRLTFTADDRLFRRMFKKLHP